MYICFFFVKRKIYLIPEGNQNQDDFNFGDFQILLTKELPRVDRSEHGMKNTSMASLDPKLVESSENLSIWCSWHCHRTQLLLPYFHWRLLQSLLQLIVSRYLGNGNFYNSKKKHRVTAAL